MEYSLALISDELWSNHGKIWQRKILQFYIEWVKLSML